MKPAILDVNAAMSEQPGIPEGMLEHCIAQDIHALVCLHGFEEARQMVAEILNYEAERKPRQ